MVLKRIMQEERCGCGLACVATLIGRDYEDVARVGHFILNRDCEKKGTSTVHLHKILGEFGYVTPIKLIPLRAKKLSELNTYAILKMPNPNRRRANWHWCVWDVKLQKIIDPTKVPDPYRIASSYLPVVSKPKRRRGCNIL